ncbi:lytic murein transglycosylase B [Parahaliea mediterranea]|uniref:Lytic murein transglycosylase B n=1 Tax=Parahaliea mediterranea TaxID=651086 RepID=A0A939DIB6_9GAMM|nr:lytic murein transglycosylase B [Parahaliea mediterranea]MBN7798538.1 lytic murein transglycosylase B [Parahaliea mediterranea]
MARHLFLAMAAMVCWPIMACAADNYGDNPSARALIEELVTEQGFDRGNLEAVFANAERQESILEAIARPAEKTKPWHEYRQIFLTEKREREGREFFAAHRETLARAEAETGVPAEIIVAIIGVETFYGRITGSYRVIDALSTLAFDYPRRSAFFTKELKNYLLLTRDQGLDPLAMKGSYAGAMGYGQFMPSSYRSYAVDFDGDGFTDIWNNPEDAIGSVANYFKRHGWRPGEQVVTAATLGGEVPDDWFNSGLKPARAAGEYLEAGLQPAMALDPAVAVTAMKFDGDEGFEYWLGLHNFYVITRYNHSAMYAMSVYQLSQRLAGGRG